MVENNTETNNQLTNKQLIIDCAIKLYANSDFSEKSPIHIAHECIDRSIVLISELKNQNII